jgi:hypothetical protein
MPLWVIKLGLLLYYLVDFSNLIFDVVSLGTSTYDVVVHSWVRKGQKTLEGNFGVLNSSKKSTKAFSKRGRIKKRHLN